MEPHSKKLIESEAKLEFLKAREKKDSSKSKFNLYLKN
jgi:hypothetical protein